MVNPELDALLAVQADDALIRGIEARRAALAPQVATLTAIHRRATEEVARTESALDRELARQRGLEVRVAELRAQQERNTAILNNAQKLRDATAAAGQLETVRRACAEAESDLLSATRRVHDLRTALAVHRDALSQLSGEQAEARTRLAAEQAALASELADAAVKRRASAGQVPSALLGKYERVAARRNTEVVVELRDFCCAACDTAIPLQRRPAFASGKVIEPCEACGVLLYHRPAPQEQDR